MKIAFFIFTFWIVLLSCSKKGTSILSGKWKVIGVQSNNSSIVDKPENIYLLEFERNSFSLQLDVNSVSGKINVRNKRTIQFDSKISMTQACCDTQFAKNMLYQLTRMTDYSLENDLLILSGNGEITLTRL